MLFNSPQFVVFFALVVVAYFCLPHRVRWGWLLAASYFFYACWHPAYLILIVASTMVDYWVARNLFECEQSSHRRMWLGVSLAMNLGILFSFKYFNFFSASLGHLVGWSLPRSELLLPVGISFYTFQTLGYTIDVFRGRQEPVRHLGHFALYVTFFPQLVAGPIERAGALLPQFQKPVRVDYDRITAGLNLMLWGLFKKVAVADRLALMVEEVYRDPSRCSGPDLVVATLCFAFQIYCDFSGYSDVAIGSAQVLGLKLMDNFNRPYSAASISEFWSRWHISLSTWFRDYVYIPLGGNRRGEGRWIINILIVFVVSGLWHGANWTFVVWGLLHGCYYLAERAAARRFDLPPRLAWLFTFSAVCLAWIFFRAESVAQAAYIVSHLGSGWALGFPVLGTLPWKFLGLTALTLGLMLVLESLQGEGVPRAEFPGPTWVQWSFCYLLLFSIILFGNYDSHPFIYFQF